MTEPLSPVAQAVLDAYWNFPWNPMLQHQDRPAIAAAFFAAVDQVDWSWEPCEQLLAIANELKGQS